MQTHAEERADAVIGALVRELQNKERLPACLGTKAESIMNGLASLRRQLQGKRGMASREFGEELLPTAIEPLDAIQSARSRVEVIQTRPRNLGLNVGLGVSSNSRRMSDNPKDQDFNWVAARLDAPGVKVRALRGLVTHVEGAGVFRPAGPSGPPGD